MKMNNNININEINKEDIYIHKKIGKLFEVLATKADICKDCHKKTDLKAIICKEFDIGKTDAEKEVLIISEKNFIKNFNYFGRKAEKNIAV